MGLINITTKVTGSTDVNERKVLASDINQIKEALQTGSKDIKPLNVHMEGNQIKFVGLNVGFKYNEGTNVMEFSNDGIIFNPLPVATLVPVTYGETISIRDVLWIDPSDGKAYKTDDSNPDWIGFASEAGVVDDVKNVFPESSIVGGFTALTIGETYGISNTAGGIEITFNNVVGIAISATQLFLIKYRVDDLDYAGIGIAQNAYQILQSNNIFENKDFLLTDEMTDSTGTNNTVNTGTSTAFFDVDQYNLTEGSEFLDSEETSITEVSSVSWTGTISGVDGFFNKFEVEVNNTSGTLTSEVKKGAVVVATKNTTITAFQKYNITFDFSDYSDTFSDTDTWTITHSGVSGIREQSIAKSKSTGMVRYTNQNYQNTNSGTVEVYNFQTLAATSGTVVCDTGTLTLDGTEDSIILYVDTNEPTNTSLTVDISDGTTTISAQSITKNSTGAIDIRSLSSGTLKLTWNLATTDVSVTPSLFGYSGYLN